MYFDCKTIPPPPLFFFFCSLTGHALWRTMPLTAHETWNQPALDDDGKRKTHHPTLHLLICQCVAGIQQAQGWGVTIVERAAAEAKTAVGRVHWA